MPSRSPWGHIRKLPSKRYQASYVAPNGVRIRAPMTFTAKTDAEGWLATQRARIVEGIWTAQTPTAKHQEQLERAERATASGEPLRDYGARWIEERLHKGRPLRDSTKSGYRSTLNNLGPQLLDTPINEITAAMVEKWYRGYIKQGKLTSASHGHSVLRAILATAVADGLISENPCQVKGASSARTGKITVPPTNAELATIIANTPKKYRALVTLAAWSALRYGEQTELRRGDIIDDGKQIEIRVRRGVTRIAGKGFVIGPPKTERALRDVVLPPKASKRLRTHLAKYVAEDDDALLFPSATGGHLNASSHKDWWYPARAKAGREDLPWHGLRHYGMTKYAKAGATLAELMARAGHSTVQAAMIYQHATGRDAELARKMEMA